MSEYQYYAFQAVDRPLGEADRQALRALSTRAEITATRFTNSYEWGNFKGDPATMMARWFDLHLYFTNWGTRRLMIRLPQRLVDRTALMRLLSGSGVATLTAVGDTLILDILQEQEEPDEDWDQDGSGELAGLAPLRTDILAGDLRLFYLLWLMAVQAGDIPEEAGEPLPGLGPMSAPLAAFVGFFGLDPDLVQAAAERDAMERPVLAQASHSAVAALPEGEKSDLLVRLLDGDPHVAALLRTRLRDGRAEPDAAARIPRRTAGDLRARAGILRSARKAARAEREAIERRRQAEAAEAARRARIAATARRGQAVWTEVKAEIERRNASGYDRAASLLTDLHAIAQAQGTQGDFARRLKAIRERHARKARFVDRLTGLA